MNVLVKILAHKLFALTVLVGVGMWLLVIPAFFILAAVACLANGLGLLPLGPSGWKWIGTETIIGALALTCIPELFLGRYRHGKNQHIQNCVK